MVFTHVDVDTALGVGLVKNPHRAVAIGFELLERDFRELHLLSPSFS